MSVPLVRTPLGWLKVNRSKVVTEAAAKRLIERVRRDAEELLHRRIHLFYCDPGDIMSVPASAHFDRDDVAGKAETVTTSIIMIKVGLSPDMLIRAFMHELGHVMYSSSIQPSEDAIADEAFAVAFSLQKLESIGCADLASMEAAEFALAEDDLYGAAIRLLERRRNPWWRKYRPGPSASSRRS